MIYRLKIESPIREVPDFISVHHETKLSDAVKHAETHKGRVWILNDESRIVAEWNGINWMTHGFKI